MSRPRDELALQVGGWLLAAAAAVLCMARGLRLTRAADVLSGAAILTGFLFGALVFVFQLRLRVTDDPHIPSFGRLRVLIDRTYGRLTGAVVAALLTTITAVLADVTAHTAPGAEPSVSRWWTAIIALFGVRLLTLMPQLVWDLTKAYREVPG
ncbi:MAG TPA: hypothetical protein VHX15_14800 [Frankiaceae bacterium]|jgi:hypothetical protein|nr:hypothetical protein [Frankiaceae bacterium]